MKRCPKCRKDYFDDSLIYCLDDGARLLVGSITDEPATAILSGDPESSDDPARQISADVPSARSNSLTFRLPAFLSNERLPWIAAIIMAFIAAIFAYGYFNHRADHRLQAIRLSFSPPTELSFNDVQPDWAVISPDGKKVAFSATANGKNMLYVRELDSEDIKLLPGAENPLEPFWSPDSKSVAYGSNGKLKRSDLNGGNAQVICDAARMVGGSWSKDGTIIFVPDYRTSLVQVSSQGGEPKPVTMNVEQDDIKADRYPYFLPDGRHFLFYREQKGVWAGSLDSPEIKQIFPDHSAVVYAEGWLILIRNESLVAQAFDALKLELSGEAMPLITAQKSWINNFRFSASNTGVLMWQGVWARNYQLTWFDREGKQVGAVGEPEQVSVGEDPHLSPDGKRVLIKRNPPNTLWVVDLERGTGERITSDFGQIPIWSPDGSRIAYSSTNGISIKPSNGLGDAETILPVGASFPYSWSPDGRFIVYDRRGVKTRFDLYALPMEGQHTESVLLNSQFDENHPALSPDGKWIAYEADDTGSYEIYVQAFTQDGKLGPDRKHVSTAGGHEPIWRRDGKELYFLSEDGQLMSAVVKISIGEIEFDTPKPLFKTRMLGRAVSTHEYDISPDGQRFLIGTLIGDSKAPPPTMIVNWTSLLKNQ
jgi:Tol biopolymer transport system component